MLPWGVLAASGSSAPSMELISTQLLTGSTSAVTFSSIPATYSHLQVRMVVKNTDSNNYAFAITYNGDTSSNYTRHELIGTGSSAVSEGSGNQSSSSIGLIATNTTANAFSAAILDIANYTNTNTFKTAQLFWGGIWGLNRVGLSSGLWRSTSAITSVTITNGNNFANGSRISIYGIRGQ